MFDTFQLHPLPEAALKALRAAASTDSCPEGLAIVGGLTEVRESGKAHSELQQGRRACMGKGARLASDGCDRKHRGGPVAGGWVR